MTDDRLHAVLAATGPVLLDFDGPVTQLLPAGSNAEVAAAAREPLLAAGYELPQELSMTTDHIGLLRFSASVDPATRQDVESICRQLESEAAQKSEPTPGATEFLEACKTASRRVVVASNNDAEAIETFLHRRGLQRFVAGVVGRPRGHPELMKPDPHTVREALSVIGAPPEAAVMIGDAVSDVAASHAVAVRIIGFAKHERRGVELAEAGADALVTNLFDLIAFL